MGSPSAATRGGRRTRSGCSTRRAPRPTPTLPCAPGAGRGRICRRGPARTVAAAAAAGSRPDRGRRSAARPRPDARGDFEEAPSAVEALRAVQRLVGTAPLRRVRGSGRGGARVRPRRPRSRACSARGRGRQLRRSGAPFEAARARIELADVPVRARSRRGGRARGTARRASAGLGAELDAGRARRTRRRRRRPRAGRAHAARARGAAACSPTLEPAIAERLVVSEHTVHRHVTNLLRKLDLPRARPPPPTPSGRACSIAPRHSQNWLCPPGKDGRSWRSRGGARNLGSGHAPPHPQAAALARIDEWREPARASTQGAAARHVGARRLPPIRDAHVWGFGPVLVRGVRDRGRSAGARRRRGHGNVAIRAAEAAREVVASTSRPRTSMRGGARPGARGVELEWVEGDAEALPFADGEFDVVTSSVGAIFAPDHQAVADELVRVCRPGGTIGMINFTPEGLAGEFFELFGRHAPPPPPGALPPVLWGSEAHVRELFGDGVGSLELTRRAVHRAQPRRPRRLPRLLQTDLRARGRPLRQPRRRARPARGLRSRLPGVRHPFQPSAARRSRPRTPTSTCSSSGDGRGDGFRVRPAKSWRGGAVRRRTRGG